MSIHSWASLLLILATQCMRVLSIPVGTGIPSLDPGDDFETGDQLNVTAPDDGSPRFYPVPRTTIIIDSFMPYGDVVPAALCWHALSKAISELENKPVDAVVGYRVWQSEFVTFTLSPHSRQEPTLAAGEALLVIATLYIILERNGFRGLDFEIKRREVGNIGWGVLTQKPSLSGPCIGGASNETCSDDGFSDISLNSTVLQAPTLNALPHYFKIPGTNLALGDYQNFGRLQAPRETLRVLYTAQKTIHRKIETAGPSQLMRSESWQSGPEILDLGPLSSYHPKGMTLYEGLMVLLALSDIQKKDPAQGCLYDVYRAGLVVGAIKLWEGVYSSANVTDMPSATS